MIQFNEANRFYYSEDFIKGFNCGAKRQAESVKIGHWEDKDVRGSIEPYCSVCGDSVDTIYHYNYCPNCGAKMIEPQEEV